MNSFKCGWVIPLHDAARKVAKKLPPEVRKKKGIVPRKGQKYSDEKIQQLRDCREQHGMKDSEILEIHTDVNPAYLNNILNYNTRGNVCISKQRSNDSFYKARGTKQMEDYYEKTI